MLPLDQKAKPVAQILPAGNDARDHFLFGLAGDQRIDRVNLVHRHKLQDVGADIATPVSCGRLEQAHSRNEVWMKRSVFPLGLGV